MRPYPPMRYSPSIEEAEPWEGKRAADLRALMRDIRETTHRLTGHAHRSLHAKSHALLEGTLDVLPGLPRELAQGMFAEPRSYPVVLRLSSNRGDILDDDIGVPRGLAMKVIGVEGARLPGARSAATQDFVLVNQPFFTEPDLRVFRRNIRIVDATTQTGLLWKKAVSAVLRPAVAAARALGRRAPTLTTMGGHPLSHPLGDAYFSQVPFRHGEYVAKYALVPVSPELRRLQDRRLDMRGRPNALRQACIAHFRRHGGVWELRVQLRTNPRTMPIENASAEWPEAESPYRTVARVTVPPQPAWNEARARLVDDGLAFNPWHGIEAHRPLGAINRARLVAYAESARFRAERNGCPIREPGRAPEWPADAPEVFGTAPGREGRRPRTPDARPGAWEPPMRPATPVVLAGLALGVALLAALPRGRGSRTATRRAVAAEARVLRARLDRAFPASVAPPRWGLARPASGVSQRFAALGEAALPAALAALTAAPGRRAGAALDALFVARPAWETAVAPALARPASILRAFRAGLSGAASPGPGAWLGPVTGRAPR